MKRLSIFIIGLLISKIIFAQTINLQGGPSFSKLDWPTPFSDNSVYDQSLIGYSLFLGLEYLNKTYFNLSSSIGLIRKGGKDEFDLTTPTGEPTGETIIEKPKLEFVSINTVIDLKYPATEKLFPFISAGPRFDFLISKSEHFDSLDEMKAVNSSAFGFLFGGGFKYELSKVQIGIRADYYLELNKLAEWPAEPGNLGGEVRTKTFTINLMIGYIIK